MNFFCRIIKCYIVCLLFICFFLSFAWSRDLDPNYKFSGVKAPESPYKNTWSAFQTDKFTGSFGYDFNFEAPPGTNGLTPKITIVYNNQSAKGKADWVGAGWNMPLSYVQRDIEYTRTDTSDDTFDLFLSGSKHDLVYVSSEDRFHTKIESFYKVEWLWGAPNESGRYFNVTAKDGTQYRFGFNTDSEHRVATTDPNMVLPYIWRWSLDRIMDTSGNTILFSYSENTANGEVYLSQIRYNTDERRRIDFILEDRPDKYLIMDQGSEVLQTKRLREVRFFVDSSLARKYVLSYDLNEAQNSSRLKSVRQFGSDGVTALPPVTFDYYPLEKGFSKTSWSTPGKGKYIRKVEDDGDVYYDVSDMNGDGLPDYVKYDEEDSEWEIWMNTGTGFSSDKNKWKASGSIKYIQDVHQETGDPSNTRSTMLDFNRDGYTDLIWANGDNDREFRFVPGTGSGFGSLVKMTLPVKSWIRSVMEVKYSSKGDPKNAPNVEQAFLDINGDGLPDLVKRTKFNEGKYNAWQIWRNTGSGFADFGIWPVYHSTGNAWLEDFERDDQDVEVTTRDMNGDGLVDIISGAKDDWRVYLNTGSHFRQYGNWTPPGLNDDDVIDVEDHDDPEKANDTKRDLVDINGDGLPDIVHAQDDKGKNWYVYFNKGDGFLSKIKWSVPLDTDYIRDVTYDEDGDEKKSAVRRDLMDINGDGLPDIVWRNDSDDDHWAVYLNSSGNADLLSGIRDMLGASISVAYTSSMKFNNTRLPHNYQVVESISTDNGMSGPHKNQSVSYFTYESGLYDFPSREFRGFGKVFETRSDGTKVIHAFHQDEARKGKGFQTETRSADNAIYGRTTSLWTGISKPEGIFFPRLDRTDEFTFDGVAEGPRQISSEFQDYDDYGNIKKEIRYGDLSDSSDDFIEYRDYLYDTEQWIVDRMIHNHITSGDGTALRENWFDFDSRGNLIREEAWLDGGENPVSSFEYDEYGNRIKLKDRNNHIDRTEYDSDFNTFPVKSWNALDQLFIRTFNPFNGQILSETDPNLFTTYFQYDVLGRKNKEIQPYDSPDLPTVEIIYNIDGTAPEYVKTMKREVSGKSGTLDTYQFVDGFGNLIQTASESEDPNYQIIADIYYDSMGRVFKQSNPYIAAASGSYHSPDIGIPSTVHDYDAVGRPVKVTNPDNTFIRRNFDHWKVTEWDENNHFTSYWFDAYQTLVKVQENNEGQTYTTSYFHNPAGELVKIIDHQNNITEIGYNTLGRKIFMNDPDLGTWRYLYDSEGNLVWQKDARGVEVSILYDEIDRKVLVDYPSDPDVRFFHDEKVIGTLSRVENAAGTVSYGHDNRLRKIREEMTMDGHTWITEWTFDASDRITGQKYPDGKEIAFKYNNQGILESIPGIVANLNYNASGLITRKAYANGISTDYEYYPANLRMKSMKTPGVQNLAYTYDNGGNVESISDGIAGTTEKFGYDHLDRLTSAGDSGYTATYSINPIGNISSETMNGKPVTYSYGEGAGPHAVTGKTIPVPVVGSFAINKGSLYATVASVTLDNVSFGSPTHYIASEDPTFSDAAWQAYSKSPVFTLSSGFALKTVYFKIKNADGESEVISDSIEYLLDTDGDSLPDKYDPDDDNDQIPDDWEIEHGMNPIDPLDALEDYDGDALTNMEEYKYGGDLNNPDADGDGWNDYDEVFVYQTSPGNVDTDGDGINDPYDFNPKSLIQYAFSENFGITSHVFDEGGNYRTDLLRIVQDRMGVLGGKVIVSEVILTITVEIGPEGGTVTLPGGMVTIYFPPGAVNETIQVTILRLNEAPTPSEGYQLVGYAYEITAINEAGEPVATFDKQVQLTIGYNTNALGIIDEADLRINYYDEDQEKWIGIDSTVDAENDTVTTWTDHFTKFAIIGMDPNADTDGDGLPDKWEIDNFGDLSHDGTADSDNDGLTDAEEYKYHTDPKKADSDDDGMPDGWEIEHGLNPLEDNSSEDPDNDGYTNLEEYQGDSNPNDPESVPVYCDISVPDDYLTIQEALDAAFAVGGGHVCIDEGLYSENIILKEGVWLKSSKLNPENTIIQGDGKKDSVIINNVKDGGILGITILSANPKKSAAGIVCMGDETPVISNCIIKNNGNGISFGGNSIPIITNNVIAENIEDGIRILGNAQGIIYNNIITNNAGTGINCNGQNKSEIRYNNVWNNGKDYGGCFAGEGALSGDPVFVNPATANYRLMPASPCVDSGKPDITDRNGTRSDMGCYGGNGRALSSNHVTFISPDNMMRITFPSGVNIADFTVNFGIAEDLELPSVPEGTFMAGNAYRITASSGGIPIPDFRKEFIITKTYGQDINCDLYLRLYYLDNTKNQWTELPTTPNSEDFSVSAIADRFGTYAAFVSEIVYDIDCDGDADCDDFCVIQHFQKQPAEMCPSCDIDRDGQITVKDARKFIIIDAKLKRCKCQ
ncbi:toxin TcdB middle/N-terminal domain-containing protein [Desulfonema limicola]|nr:toxin TcdB middle/N-terminal domain-containing protein [Desulfonema limicola]